MTREEAIRCLSVHSSTNGSGLCTDEQHYEAKQMAIQALEQEPCDDCISRQAVLELVADYDLSMGQVVRGIHALLPVTPQPKTGHWIERRNRATGHIESVCSKCGAEEGYPYNDYCGNCGAKMVGQQKRSE